MAKSKTIRMKDIANILGVSVSTVSKAIKGSYDVSEQTRQKVLKLVEELDFEPNKQAQSLLHNQSYTVGVVVPDLENSFFGAIIRGVENVAYANGYNLMICQSHENKERELSDLKSLVNQQVDGLIIALASSSDSLTFLNNLLSRDFPIVLADRGTNSLEVPQVLVDDYEGGKQATNLLFESGCYNVVHIAGPESLYNVKQRAEGYMEVCRMNGQDPIIYYSTFDEEYAYQQTLKMLEEYSDIDGVFAASDRIAVGVIQAIKSKGFKIPEDISVIGFSDLYYSKYLEPALTTISQPAREMGETAMEMLLQMMCSTEQKPIMNNKVFKTNLIKRGSTR